MYVLSIGGLHEKWLKIILGLIGTFILLLIIDLICIFTINKRLFAIKQDNGDSVNLIFRRTLYDTYFCHQYFVPQIKMKKAKLSSVEFSTATTSKKINYKGVYYEDRKIEI